MEPVKYAIYQVINTKCVECKDFTFCKLPGYYYELKNPTEKDLSNLKKCIFFKKQQSGIKYVQTWI